MHIKEFSKNQSIISKLYRFSESLEKSNAKKWLQKKKKTKTFAHKGCKIAAAMTLNYTRPNYISLQQTLLRNISPQYTFKWEVFIASQSLLRMYTYYIILSIHPNDDIYGNTI